MQEPRPPLMRTLALSIYMYIHSNSRENTIAQARTRATAPFDTSLLEIPADGTADPLAVALALAPELVLVDLPVPVPVEAAAEPDAVAVTFPVAYVGVAPTVPV